MIYRPGMPQRPAMAGLASKPYPDPNQDPPLVGRPFPTRPNDTYAGVNGARGKPGGGVSAPAPQMPGSPYGGMRGGPKPDNGLYSKPAVMPPIPNRGNYIDPAQPAGGPASDVPYSPDSGLDSYPVKPQGPSAQAPSPYGTQYGQRQPGGQTQPVRPRDPIAGRIDSAIRQRRMRGIGGI